MALILLAERNSVFRDLHKRMLCKSAFLPENATIFEARDGQSAVDILQEQLVHLELIVAELDLPGVAGIDFLRKVRGEDADIPFVLLIERPEKKAVLAARNAGVTAVLSIPFSQDELDSKLAHVLEFQAF